MLPLTGYLDIGSGVLAAWWHVLRTVREDTHDHDAL
jgi:hypothetical protein